MAEYQTPEYFFTEHSNELITNPVRENAILNKVFGAPKPVSSRLLKEYIEILTPARPNEKWIPGEGPMQYYGYSLQEQERYVPMLEFGMQVGKEQVKDYESKGIDIIVAIARQIQWVMTRELEIMTQYRRVDTVYTNKTIYGIGSLSGGSTRITYNDPGASVTAAGTSLKSDGTGIVTDFETVRAALATDNLPGPSDMIVLMNPEPYIYKDHIQATYANFYGWQLVKDIAKDNGIKIDVEMSPFLDNAAPTADTSIDTQRWKTSATNTTGFIAWIEKTIAQPRLFELEPLTIEVFEDNEAKRFKYLARWRIVHAFRNCQGILLHDDVKTS